MKTCSVEGCEREHYGVGLCEMHYKRQKLTGTTEPGKKARGTLEDRFWRKVEKSHGGCWEWAGGKRPNGYGQIQSGGAGSKTESAHRLSYRLHHGEIPDGVVVMHRCDNPGCVNPAHLRLGSYSANTRDAIQKKRWPQAVMEKKRRRGEAHGNALLDNATVRRIKASRHSAIDIAKHIGRDHSTVVGIKAGNGWAHIQPDGTEQEFDIVAIDRRRKNGVHHNSKFTAEQIQYIKASPKTGLDLAAEFGVVKQTIYRIRNA